MSLSVYMKANPCFSGWPPAGGHPENHGFASIYTQIQATTHKSKSNGPQK